MTPFGTVRIIWLTIMGLLLSYVLWGELKYGDEPLTDERVQTVFSLIHEMDGALGNPSSKERMNTVNTILIRCWTYIKDFLEHCRTSSPGSGSELTSELMAGLVGASKSAEGDSTPVADRSGTSTLSAKGKRAATARLAAKASESESESE